MPPLRFAFILLKVLNFLLRFSWLQLFISTLSWPSLPDFWGTGAHNCFLKFTSCVISSAGMRKGLPYMSYRNSLCFFMWYLLLLQLCEEILFYWSHGSETSSKSNIYFICFLWISQPFKRGFLGAKTIVYLKYLIRCQYFIAVYRYSFFIHGLWKRMIDEWSYSIRGND